MLLSWGNANKSCSSVYLTYIFHQRRSPWVAAVTDLECRSLDEVRWALVNFRQGLIELRALLFELLRHANVAYCFIDLLGCQGTFLKDQPPPKLWEHNERILEFLLFIAGTDTSTKRGTEVVWQQEFTKKHQKSQSPLGSRLGLGIIWNFNNSDSSSSFWFRFLMILDSDSFRGRVKKVSMFWMS